MIARMLRFAMIGAGALATAAVAQIPPDLAAKIAAIGPRIDPVATGQLYAPLQPAAPAKGLIVRRDVPYGPDAKETFDLFAPAAGKKQPIMIFVHGGGFRADDKKGVYDGSPFYENVVLWAAAHGMVGINFNYPLAPGATYPKVQHDLALTVAWARAHAAEIGGDPDRVFVWGHSAGAAHVASYLAHPETYEDVLGARQPVAAGILFSGPYDLTDNKQDNIYYGPLAGLRERSSVVGLVRSDVPLFLEAGELNPPGILAQTEALAAALKAAGRTYVAVIAKQHSHMSEIYSVNTGDASITAPLLDFLTKVPSRLAGR